jgi:NADP-dependent 3-hydroxy acid dehydrogenase YdfG
MENEQTYLNRKRETRMILRNEGVFILTGATGGAAGGVAEVFSEAGARLVLTGRDAVALRERASRYGGLAVPADLADLASAAHVVEEALRAHGRVDGLIHLAGGFAMSPAHETAVEEYERMMDINMRTLFCATRAILPSLRAQRDGFVAGISSAPVRGMGGAGMTSYTASKGALTAYLRALAAEARESGIRVAVVFPMRSIDTPANRGAMPKEDPASWIDPREIGVALLVASTRGPQGELSELVVGVRKARDRP